jgi:hypothetical protein
MIDRHGSEIRIRLPRCPTGLGHSSLIDLAHHLTQLRVLPDQGRVRLKLLHLGPEEGSYSPDQVEALFNNFLLEGEVRSFDLVRMNCSDDQFALVDARVQLIDREGRPQRSGLHITFQPEQARWVLREIRESSP